MGTFDLRNLRNLGLPQRTAYLDDDGLVFVAVKPQTRKPRFLGDIDVYEVPVPKLGPRRR